MVVFAVIFAVMLLASLLVAERLAPKGPTLDAEDEFVKRYQEVIGPYARWLRVGVVVVLSLIVGSQAIGQWNNWILFQNSTPFGAKDPQFHRNVGYFVFTLPFEQFLVHWALVALFVVLLVTLLSHYLNGGIRLQGSRPRVRPAVKAHISVILGPAGPGQGGGLLPGPLQPRPVQQRLRPGRRLHRCPRPAARPRAAHPGVDGRRGPAHLQHPPPGLGPAHPGGGAVVPGGPDRRDHLPGRRPGAQGQSGAEHPRTPVHPAQHRRHPRGHGHQRGQERSPTRRPPRSPPPSCRPTATPWPTSDCGTRPRPSPPTTSCRTSAPTTSSTPWPSTATR